MFRICVESLEINKSLTLTLEKTRVVFKENGKFVFAFNKEESEQSLVATLKSLNFHNFNKRKSRHKSIQVFKVEELKDQPIYEEKEEDLDIKPENNFVPPLFGVTPLPHPTVYNRIEGIILWINGRAALVDPPIFTK